MALEIFDGRPGDGKSYHAMCLKILPHLARGGYVATNIEVRPDGVAAWIKARTGRVFKPERLRFLEDHEVANFHKHIPAGSEKTQVLVVLDECHLWFNSRDYRENDKGHRETFNLATQHRKYFLDIVLISQHFANIDGQFLRLVEGLWRFRDFKKWHVPMVPWLKLPFFRFRATKFDRDGKTVVERHWSPFSKLVADTYNTRAVGKGLQMADTVDDVELEQDPAAAKKVKRILFVINWILMILFAVVVGFGAYWLGKRRGTQNGRQQQEAIQSKKPPAKTAANTGAASPAPSQPAKEDAGVLPSFMVRPSAESKPAGTWLDEPAPFVVRRLEWVAGPRSDLRLCVELDGLRQILYLGGETSRGKVMAIRQQAIKVWDVEFSAAVGAPRRSLRLIQQNATAVAVEAAPVQLMESQPLP